MIKRISVFLLLVIFFSLSYVIAQNEVLDTVPGGDLIQKAVGEDGDGVNDIKDRVDNFREQDKSYLWKEWTKMPYIGKVLGAMEGFFSFFNPLWKYTFGMEFSWNFAFFLHIILWGIIIFFVYYPSSGILNNKLLGIVCGVVVASITGSVGIITMFVGFIDTAFGDLWWVTIIVFLIIFILLVLWKAYFEASEKESDKEKLEKSKKDIKALGEVADKSMKKIGEG
jgi:hypothetical protein